jgi:tetratricopeptide (TPR) repeat protein
MSHIYLATALERAGQFRRAVGVYQQVVEMRLGTELIFSRLGNLYLRLHDLDKAVDAMTRASQLNPADLDNFRNLATACLQLRPPRVEEAERAFKAIVRQNDHYAAAYNGLGLVAIQRGNAQAARENFQKAVDLDSTEVEPLLNLGLLYEKAGNQELAIHYYKMFLERASHDQYAEQISLVREEIGKLGGER